MADDFPGREIIEFMTYAKTVLSSLGQRLDGIAQLQERLRERIDKLEQEQAMRVRDPERITALEGKSPCDQCPTRKDFEAFYAKDWPAIRDKVLVWSGIIGAAVIAANILIKVL